MAEEVTEAVDTAKEDIKASAIRMSATLNEIAAIAADAARKRTGDYGLDWKLLSKALADIRKLCPVPITDAEYFTPKAAAEAARTASETPARKLPQIRDYRTTYIAGKDVYSLMALDDSEAHNQYTIFCRKENGQFAGRFFINNELKFTVTVPSLLRCRHITLSAANSYLHMNDRAMARRHKRRERARAAAKEMEG